MKTMVFLKSGRRAEVFGQVRNIWISLWPAVPAPIYLPEKLGGGGFTVSAEEE